MVKKNLSFVWSTIVSYLILTQSYVAGTCVKHSGNSANRLLGVTINICQRVNIITCPFQSGTYPSENPTMNFECEGVNVNNDFLVDGCGCVNNTRLDVNLAFVVDMAYASTQNFAIQVLSAYYSDIYNQIDNNLRINVQYVFVGGSGLEPTIYYFEGASNYNQLTSQNLQSLVNTQNGSPCSGVAYAIQRLQEKAQQSNNEVSNNIIVLNFSPLQGDAGCQSSTTFQNADIHTYAINFFEVNDLSNLEQSFGQVDECAGAVTEDATNSGVTFNNMNPLSKLSIHSQMVTSISDFMCLASTRASIPETKSPTKLPTKSPTKNPTKNPTKYPTKPPTLNPTIQPTARPTDLPTVQPTVRPTIQPTVQPTDQPTARPTGQPTVKPTLQPTAQPTDQPTIRPTVQPTINPTSQPTIRPTVNPTIPPTVRPTMLPSVRPTTQPTVQPTSRPTINPTLQPTVRPTNMPTLMPTKVAVPNIVRVPPKRIHFEKKKEDSDSPIGSHEFYNHRESADSSSQS